MTTKPNVIEAISNIIREMPGIGKDSQAAAQQGGYAYRGIEAITREVQPLFARYGVVVAPHVHSFEVDHINVNNKPWTDTRLLVSYTVYGPGGVEDCIEVGPILAIGRDNADKGANKCMTQAFKYLLLQLLCVSDAKDDGDQTSVQADSRHARPVPPPVPDGMVGAGEAKQRLLAAYGGDKEAAKAAWGDRGSAPIWDEELAELERAAVEHVPHDEEVESAA